MGQSQRANWRHPQRYEEVRQVNCLGGVLGDLTKQHQDQNDASGLIRQVEVLDMYTIKTSPNSSC